MSLPATENSLEVLSSLIQKSSFIGESEKIEFINILPSLSEDQYKTMLDFFVSGEKELDAINSEFNSKKNELYSAMSPILNESFKQAKKMILVVQEAADVKGDMQNENKLLEELNNI